MLTVFTLNRALGSCDTYRNKNAILDFSCELLQFLRSRSEALSHSPISSSPSLLLVKQHGCVVMDKTKVSYKLCGGRQIHLSSSKSDTTSGSVWTDASPQARALQPSTQENVALWPVHMQLLKDADV